jgi:hypothetical protein
MTTEKARNLLPYTVVRDTKTHLKGTLIRSGFRTFASYSYEYVLRIVWENGLTEFRRAQECAQIEVY